MQWGASEPFGPYNQYHIINQLTFPINFPHKILSLTISPTMEPLLQDDFTHLERANGANDIGFWVLTKNNTGFTWYAEAIGTPPSKGNHYKLYWLAIGY